jgi:predicted nuclease of predicted toxin-antitoxin system
VKILIDMNLSPNWIQVFKQENWEAYHWSTVGSPTASDSEILDWARKNDCIVFTHDLDFGVLLASQPSRSPSILQLRGQETSPGRMGEVVVVAIRQFRGELEFGALISIDAAKARARILPLP